MSGSYNSPLSARLKDRLKNTITSLPAAQGYVVAFSGGLDSTVLLKALAAFSDASKKSLISAVHVNHGLSPNAQQWAAHCRSVCSRLDIRLSVVPVEVNQQHAQGLESAARDARYRAFSEIVKERELLLQGHHQNDQAETVLLRLVKGHGLRGLAGIPESRLLSDGATADAARIIRPLLDFSRSELEAIARDWGLCWIEDESNLDERFDRNYLRHKVMPKLIKRWSGVVGSIAESAKRIRESESLLREFALRDIEDCCNKADRYIALDQLSKLSHLRQKNCLRFWLGELRVEGMSEKLLEETLSQVRDAATDSQLEIHFKNAVLRRYRDRLFLLPSDSLVDVDQSKVWIWDMTEPLLLPNGTLLAEPADSGLRGPRPEEKVTVRFRRGGERFRPAGRRGSCSLKKWMQEAGIPPWRRNRVPLIFYDAVLVAVVSNSSRGYLSLSEVGAAESERRMTILWNALNS